MCNLTYGAGRGGQEQGFICTPNFTRLGQVITVLSLILTFMVVAWYFAYFDGIREELNFHGIFCTLGFAFLAHGVSTFKRIKGGVPNDEYLYYRCVHAVYQSTALVCIVIGTSVAFVYGTQDHMTSMHSWLGTISVCLMFWLALVGWFGRSDDDTQEQLTILKMMHKALGMLLICFITTCMFLGVYEKREIVGEQGDDWAFTSLIVVIFIIGFLTIYISKPSSGEDDYGMKSPDYATLLPISTSRKDHVDLTLGSQRVRNEHRSSPSSSSSSSSSAALSSTSNSVHARRSVEPKRERWSPNADSDSESTVGDDY